MIHALFVPLAIFSAHTLWGSMVAKPFNARMADLGFSMVTGYLAYWLYGAY